MTTWKWPHVCAGLMENTCNRLL